MIIVLLFVIFISLFIFLSEKKYTKYGLIMCIIALALVFGLRNNIGADDQRYRFFYEIIQTKDADKYWELSGVEASFQILSYLLSTIGLNYKSIFLCYSAIGFLFFYLLTRELQLKKSQLFLWLLLFMAFCFLPYITVMRQFTASMIFLYVLIKFRLKEVKYWVPLLALSIFIHNFTIFLCPLFFLKHLHLNFFEKKTFLIGLPILCFLLNKLPIWELARTILSSLNIDYAHYIIHNGDSGLFGSGLVVTALFVLFIISVIKLRHEKINDKTKKLFLLLGSAFFSIYYLTKDIGFIGRAYYGFLLFEGSSIVLLSSIQPNIPKKYKQLLYISCCSLLISLSFYNINKTAGNAYSIQNYSVQIIGEIE